MKTLKIITASFDVDAQKGFTPLCPNELPVADGHLIAPYLNEMAEVTSFRLGSKDAHAPNADWVVSDKEDMIKPTGLPNADLTWVSHCVVGTEGYELIDGLPAPADYDYFVYKGVEKDLHPYGACYHDIAEKQSTGAIEFLKSKGVTDVVVGGLALDYCVKHTAIQLNNAGFCVAVYIPATKAIDAENIKNIINDIASSGIYILKSKKELMSWGGN